MIELNGIFENGKIILEKEVTAKRPVKVIVTFIDEDAEDIKIEEKHFRFNDFSFAKSRELLKNLKTSLSDAVIEERRSEL